MDKKELDMTALKEKVNAFAKSILSFKNEGEKIILKTGDDVGFDIWVDAIEGEDLEGREIQKIVAGEVVEEPVEDGSYDLADGSTITIEGGKVGSIGVKEEGGEGNEEMAKEIEELKAKLEEKEAMLNSANAELETFKADAEANKEAIENLTKEFEDIKNLTVGAKDTFTNKASKQVDNSEKFFK